MLMKRPLTLTAIVATSLLQGFATSHGSEAVQITNNNKNGVAEAAACGSANARPCADSITAGSNPVSPIALCTAPEGCSRQTQAVIHGAEIGMEKNAPVVEGHPLTSVVVTQCNMVVAVYMTMPDGRFLRFDQRADVPADQLISTAYTATRSERVEVSCEGTGVVGYEKHEPV
jgi:hypothetical protein